MPFMVIGDCFKFETLSLEAAGQLALNKIRHAFRALCRFGRCFKLIGKSARGRQRLRILLADFVFGDHALAACFRQLRHELRDLGLYAAE